MQGNTLNHVLLSHITVEPDVAITTEPGEMPGKKYKLAECMRSALSSARLREDGVIDSCSIIARLLAGHVLANVRRYFYVHHLL